MAGHSGAAFEQNLQAEPWYPAFAGVFASYGIPQWIPDAIVANEDPSLALTAQGSDARSVGLFQINLDAHPEISQSQAEDPIASALWSAQRIQPILAAHPELGDPANAPATIKALEGAGWPGGTGLVQLPDGTWYNETPDRLADAQNVIGQLGLSGGHGAPVSSGSVTDGTPQPAPGAAPPPVSSQPNAQTGATASAPWDPFGLQGLWANVSAWITTFENNVFFGAIALALIAGGFAWLAATSGRADTHTGEAA